MLTPAAVCHYVNTLLTKYNLKFCGAVSRFKCLQALWMAALEERAMKLQLASTQVLVLAKGATKRPENIKMQTRLIQ